MKKIVLIFIIIANLAAQTYNVLVSPYEIVYKQPDIKYLKSKVFYNKKFKKSQKYMSENELKIYVGDVLDFYFILRVKISSGKAKASVKYIYLPTFPDNKCLIKITKKELNKHFYIIRDTNDYINIHTSKMVKKMLFDFSIIGYVSNDSIIDYSGASSKEKELVELKNKIASHIDTSWQPKVKEKEIIVRVDIYNTYDKEDAECYIDSNVVEKNKVLLPFYENLLSLLKEEKINLYHPKWNDMPIAYDYVYERLNIYLGSDIKMFKHSFDALYDNSFLFVHYKWRQVKEKNSYVEPVAITLVIRDKSGVIPSEKLLTIYLKDLKKLDFPYKEFIAILSDTKKIAMYPVKINDYKIRYCKEARYNYKKYLNFATQR